MKARIQHESQQESRVFGGKVRFQSSLMKWWQPDLDLGLRVEGLGLVEGFVEKKTLHLPIPGPNVEF